MTAPTVIQDLQQPVVDISTRIWRLHYGPCWCGSAPADSGSFDYVRVRRSSANLGSFRENLLIVSERVIDGSARMYRSIHSEVPDPKLVITVSSCPMAGRFWDELPNGWTAVDDILPVDIRVEDCINGHPEALLSAVLGHFLSSKRTGSSAGGPQGVDT